MWESVLTDNAAEANVMFFNSYTVTSIMHYRRYIHNAFDGVLIGQLFELLSSK